MAEIYLSLYKQEMNRIRAFVSAKDLTPVDCVKLTPNVSYNDGIIKGFDYQNISQKTISITNNCVVPFDIVGINLFSDTTNGGDFTASLSDFSIGANQTIDIPVFYNGIYLGDNLSPNYQISINGNYAVYSLIVTVPYVNSPPVADDITIDLNNRQNYTLTITDFLNHFSDIDGDDLAGVIIEGNVVHYRLNGNPLVSGDQIPRTYIESGLLQFIAPDTDDYSEDGTIWKAIDTAGNISL